MELLGVKDTIIVPGSGNWNEQVVTDESRRRQKYRRYVRKKWLRN